MINAVVEESSESTHKDSIQNETERIRLAELNLRATEKSVSFAAFSGAIKYAEKGIECLPKDCWESNYNIIKGFEISLVWTRCLAEVCFVLKWRSPKGKKEEVSAIYRTVKHWCKQENPNVQHVKVLFEAQKATIRKKHGEADTLFQSGIALAARGVFIQGASIGSEL